MFRLSLLAFLFIILSAPTSAAEFRGYLCTQDCSGHKAGYAWAEEKGLTQSEQCGGHSNSFVEGCYAWTKSLTQSDANSPLETLQSPDLENTDTPAQTPPEPPHNSQAATAPAAWPYKAEPAKELETAPDYSE